MNEIFAWDHYSDQPHIIKDKRFKKNARKKYIKDYILMLFLSLIFLPLSFVIMWFFRTKPSQNTKDFYGLGVNLDKGNIQQELVEELGVKNLLIRLPLSDVKNLDAYYEFAKSFGDKHIVLNILQDREHIEDLKLLRLDLDKIFTKFDALINEYQIGNAINRLKWGFFSVSEYLSFYEVAYKLKQEKYPQLKLLGSSVIDFEYYYTVRSFFTFKPIRYDITSSLLYVDRRGSPKKSQYLFFDLKNKINLLFALTKLSCKASSEIYITETNYPLSNTFPYAPTSETECVSNETYTRHMEEYHEEALKTGKIKKVFWHQLIAPGYGLVDNRGEKVVKLPQFYAYKKMLEKAT